jgi:hypothetical protein
VSLLGVGDDGSLMGVLQRGVTRPDGSWGTGGWLVAI